MFSRPRPETFTFNHTLFAIALLYWPLTWLGYGNQIDTYGMLDTWKTLAHHHFYIPSRWQGHLIPELMIGAAAQIGSFYLSNFLSLILALLTLKCFHSLLKMVTESPLTHLGILAVATHPQWIIVSTTSQDDIYAIFFFLLGVLLLEKSKLKTSGLVFALAASSRIVYAPMALITYFISWRAAAQESRHRNQLWLGFFIFVFSSSLLFLPALVYHRIHWQNFFTHAPNVGGTFALLARFLYKNIFFWGLALFAVLTLFFARNARSVLADVQNGSNDMHGGKKHTSLPLLFILLFFYTECLFLSLPHEPLYLLPILFSVTFYAVRLANGQLVLAIIGLNMIHCLFSVEFLEIQHRYSLPSQPVVAESASFRLSIKPGILRQDISERKTKQKYYFGELQKKWNRELPNN